MTDGVDSWFYLKLAYQDGVKYKQYTWPPGTRESQLLWPLSDLMGYHVSEINFEGTRINYHYDDYSIDLAWTRTWYNYLDLKLPSQENAYSNSLTLDLSQFMKKTGPFGVQKIG